MVNANMSLVEVTKDEFYKRIGPLERVDTGAQMRHYPEKMLRWRVRQWIDGGYKEVAASEMLLDRPYPHPQHYYLATQ